MKQVSVPIEQGALRFGPVFGAISTSEKCTIGLSSYARDATEERLIIEMTLTTNNKVKTTDSIRVFHRDRWRRVETKDELDQLTQTLEAVSKSPAFEYYEKAWNRMFSELHEYLGASEAKFLQDARSEGKDDLSSLSKAKLGAQREFVVGFRKHYKSQLSGFHRSNVTEVADEMLGILRRYRDARE